jgi:hypothetical protein
MRGGGARMDGKLAGACVFCALLLAGCATVPPLQEDGVAIGEIVQRVKCEIAFAVPEPRPPWPTGAFQWMRNWTAKIDLTLVTNAKSTISPTAVFTKLVPSVPIAGVGNVPRNFTFGVGAGVDTSADRTEVMSFSVSLAEMRKFKDRGDCNLPEGFDLYGRLGLREWIESALAPVEFGQLKVGRHPPPGGKSPPPPPISPPPLQGFQAPPEELARLIQAKESVEHYANVAKSAADSARENGVKDDIQATYDDARRVNGALSAADAEFGKAKNEATELQRQLSPERYKELKPQIDKLLEEAKKAASRAIDAKSAVETVINGLPRDPPIDSLSHSVKFVVALSASVSPNWLLVDFRGPTASGTLASGSYTRTHTLSIAMGHPAVLPNEQSRQLNNLVIIQNLGARPTQ